jgi:hypothetical protein
MIRVSKTISINGVEVTMLFTPRLFVMAQELNIKLSVNTADVMATLSTYADMCFCAALNYWTMDNDVESFPLKRIDFHEWSAANQIEFGKVMTMAAEAISGKSMKEIVQEQKEARESGEEVKKKPKSNVIIRLLRHFL